jgi:hypothetical protein
MDVTGTKKSSGTTGCLQPLQEAHRTICPPGRLPYEKWSSWLTAGLSSFTFNTAVEIAPQNYRSYYGNAQLDGKGVLKVTIYEVGSICPACDTMPT